MTDKNGILNVNKEKGPTSFAVVSQIRRMTGVSKAGHTGTLDPLASGVLMVCLGKFTRLSRYLMGSDKTYAVKMILGFSTDTYDLEGETTMKHEGGFPTEGEFIDALKSFKGESLQPPPMFSAVKVDGRKLYDYARKGEKIEPEPRKININSISGIRYGKTTFAGRVVPEAEFVVNCSKGTYIRSLCVDIGKKLGVPAVMSELIRTANGDFDVGRAHTMEKIRRAASENRLTDLFVDPFASIGLESVRLDEAKTDDYMKGRVFTVDGKEPGEYIVRDFKGDVIGIGIIDEKSGLKSGKRLV